MTKPQMHTPDLVAQNIEWVAERLPGCITESMNEKGEVVRAVDFDFLRQELSPELVEGPQERYHLNWPGKREALLAANAPIAKTLRPCREESVDFDTTQNLFIEGDNLDALKLLQETYLNKVKMIYIDPPYNTGNDFVYSDRFASSTAEYLLLSRQQDDTGQRLVANTESNGRFHSDWLSMLYPRLRLARSLLADAGLIFVSIDDGEAANLRLLMDEVFGGDNFVAAIAWEKRYTRSNNARMFYSLKDTILVYRKSATLAFLREPRSDESKGIYSNPDNDPRGVWTSSSYVNPATKENRPNLVYPITSPKGAVIEHPTHAWKYSLSEHERHVAEKRLWWGQDGTAKYPRLKVFLEERPDGLVPIDIWKYEESGTTDEGGAELKQLFGAAVFDNPKPTKLIQRMLSLLPSDEKDGIVLDFFAGSGSSAHALMAQQMNGGAQHRFIMVQLPEECAVGSEAMRLGFRNIAAVSKERIRKAGGLLREKATLLGEHSDLGFRVLKVDSSNMKDVYYRPDKATPALLGGHVDNIKEDRSDEDLLFQVLLDWGVDLSLSIKKETISGKPVYFVDTNALAACFASGIDEEFVKELASRKPLRAVFRDAGYGGDDVKINVEQIFKQLSPGTEVKTL